MPRLPQLLVKFGGNYLLSQLPKIADCLNATSSPWATRAWTFQEGLLSRRCILLTRYQAYFSCNTFCRSEDTPDGTGPDQETVPRARLFGMLLNPVDSMMFQKWVPKRTKYSVYNHLVSQFLSRNLTNDGDALNAVAALLNQMAYLPFERDIFSAYLWAIFLKHCFGFKALRVTRTNIRVIAILIEGILDDELCDRFQVGLGRPGNRSWGSNLE
jgi:hypothetical protein